MTRRRWVYVSAAAALLALTSTLAAQRYTGTPPPRVQESIHPVRVVSRNDGGANVFFIDFGRDAFGQLDLQLAPTPADVGRKVTVRLGEMLAGPDHLNAAPGGSIRFLETTITMEADKTRYQPQLPRNDARRMPAALGGALPFRYAELINLPAGMTTQDVAAHVTQVAVHEPFDDAAADFSCSDEKLNAVWSLSKYSMKATSFAGIFVDGDRERTPYEADAYINQLGWYYATTDTTLPRYSHEYLITHPTWPTEWIMFSVLMGWEDYRYTGATTSLKAFYDDLKAKTLRGLERPDGLISTAQVPNAVENAIHFNGTLRDIVDWPATERDNYDMRPVNTVVNAFHCRALALLASMADALGKADDAADFRKAADRTRQSLNSTLFDTATGLYLDGEGSTHNSLHANMFPLAFGLVPADRREKVAAFVESRGMACSVYGAQFLLEALLENGRAARAVQLMVAPGDRSWRHMVEDVGATITLEAWDNKYKPNQDWNHAWGAAPANILPRKILGVEPLTPGYQTTLIYPRTAPVDQPGALTWAKGQVPTVKGPVRVEWRRSATGFDLTTELPPHTEAEIHLPGDWGTDVTLSPADPGHTGVVQAGRDADGSVVLSATGGGPHRWHVGR